MPMTLNGDGSITGLAAGGLPDASVTTAELADGAVTTAKITDANVTTAKIADLNVTTAKVADGAITSAKILDGTIATADIADSAITTAKIANANVTVAKLSATGTPSATTYLRGDGTWGTPAGGVTSITAGGGLTGGTITGSGTIAIDTSTYAIGQTGVFFYTSTTTVAAGNPVSGSNLFYVSSIGSAISANNGGQGIGTIAQIPLNLANRTTAFTINTGVNAISYSPVGGTWRVLTTAFREVDVCGMGWLNSVVAIRTA